MSDFLRGLLGVAQGAGQGYFRGKAMQRDQAMEDERLAMARKREQLAEEDQRFQQEDRERRAAEGRTKASNDIRDQLRQVMTGARHGGLLKSLMANPNDTEAANTLMAENPQMLTAARTELGRREPKELRPPPSRTTDRGIEEFTDGAWAPTGRTPYRAPLRSGGGGGDAAPRKSEQDEEIQGQAIMRQLKGQPPEIQKRFAESFSQAFNPQVSPGRIAFRVWSAMQDMSLPRGVTGGAAASAPVQSDSYAVAYQRLIDQGMKPAEAAAQARRETGAR